MNRQAVVKGLIAVARELTAMVTVKERTTNAEEMIKSGGRGIELGIREIEYLSHDMAELAKHLRRIQNSRSWANTAQTDMLEVLWRYTGQWR